MIGNIYIIELHADLGGDLIADELLPKACPSFDFFEVAVEAAVGNYMEGNSLDFNPTALIYEKSKYNIQSLRGFEISEDLLFFNHESQLENHRNLAKLFHRCNFHSIPLHYKWLNKCKGN